MEEEIWKDIYYYNEPKKEWVDYRGLYQVSNLGRVRSLDRLINHRNRKCFKQGKILNHKINYNGYHVIGLFNDGEARYFLISRLVYFTFNPDADTTLQVNHIDEDKSNNRLDNFNLMTAKENCNYGTRVERFSKGHKKPIIQYDLQGNFIRQWASAKDVKRELGIDNGHIGKCCMGIHKSFKGYIWKYVDVDKTKRG